MGEKTPFVSIELIDPDFTRINNAEKDIHETFQGFDL